MKKSKRIVALILAVSALLFGVFMLNTGTAQAKSYSIPKSIRGTWYCYDNDNGKFYKLRYGKKGEYQGKTFMKQRGKVKSVKLKGKKYHEIWTSVNPYDVRTTTGKFAGKKRRVLWFLSQGTATAYFRKKIRVTYQQEIF